MVGRFLGVILPSSSVINSTSPGSVIAGVSSGATVLVEDDLK